MNELQIDYAAGRAVGEPPSTAAAEARPRRRTVWQQLRRDRVAVASMAVLLAIVLLAVFAPWLTTGDPYTGSALQRLKPIGTPGHVLGTDEIGRDLWTRIAYGGRLSLLSGIVPVAVALILGGALGVLAGYAGGRLNTLVMRTMDVFYAFPSVLLAIGIASVVGTGMLNTILALSIVFIPPMARITESVTTRVRNMDFVEAARASGVGDLQIIRYHILSNVLGPVLVYAASLTSISIVLAAGLSFLGLGVPPPNAEWGQMLNSLRQSIYVQPWLAALPGFMILLTSMCFNLISDGLRGAMDVRRAA